MLMDEVIEKNASGTLTPAEKRDLRRAAKQLKKLEAEDKAQAKAAADADPDIIRPAATNAQLVSFIERVEQVELEMAERSKDRKQIYTEARSVGFDVPTMKKVVALRKMDADDRRAADELLTKYMHGCGMLQQTEMDL